MSDIIQLENKYYISVNSTYTDDRTKVLNHADTFGIFDRWGNIRQLGEEVQGIYHFGMRFINDLQLRIQGERPLLLSSSVKEENEILSVDLTNPSFKDIHKKHIAKDTIYIGRSKFLRNGCCYEEIRLSNYGNETCEFELTLSLHADFKDIFEIRGMKRDKRGEVYKIAHQPDNVLRISYLGLDDVKRRTEARFSIQPSGWIKSSTAIFRIKLGPHEQKNFDYTLLFLTGDEQKENKGYTETRLLLEQELKESAGIISKLTTSNEMFNQWVDRSQFDLLSLVAETRYGKYPYAGVPWYNTPFGRDGIITALQTLWVAPAIARDVLWHLAQTQATEENAFRDAEPGKIIHEIRGGEMVTLGEIPFQQYYGSVDATPLFLVLAGAYYKRTSDLNFIKKIWGHIEAALDWIDVYGDTDGDGFTDYKHKSENGLTNQGWKDSFDSISYENGELAIPPIALCEVQGYVYDAKMQAAMLAALLGKADIADKLRAEAAALKKHFNEKFWDEELQSYVLALDGHGKACRVAASNAGHCLFSGIADAEKAAKVAQRLMQDDMYSGWGVRTLGTKEVRYNPMSYHNGSVWPHDVAIIARGFARYGFQKQVMQLTTVLFNASQFIELQRLPELFCGFDRRRSEGPTEYPVACSPQAWAVGAAFMLLEGCLNIDINADRKTVYFHRPVLPDDIDYLQIEGLQLGGGYATIELRKVNRTIGIEVIECPEGWTVEQMP